MRVLFVPHAYAPVRGGTEILCQRIAESFAERGHTVRVLTTDAGAVDAYYRLGIPAVQDGPDELNGVAIVRVPLAGPLGALGTSLAISMPPSGIRGRVEARTLQLIRAQLVGRFAREIAGFHPDVVVTMPHLVVNVEAVLKVHRARPFPLVMLPLLHEEDPHWDPARMREALRQANAVVAITHGECRRLVEAYGVAPASTFLGGMGVDLPPRDAGAQAGGRSVVFLGRKTPKKGIPVLVDAMREVWTTSPDVPLVLAGARGGDSLAIDAYVAALPPPLARNVSSEDNITDARKAEILNRAACLVLPSRIESFGGVLLEAWAAGVPVIALDLPVFREIVEPGRDGLLVPPDDPAPLAEAIRWMLDHPQDARAMGLAGLTKVRAQFTWATVTQPYVDACAYAVKAFRAGRA